MFFESPSPHPQPLEQIWISCSQARDWFQSSPKNAPHHFALLYQLELSYTISTLLSPCPRYPNISDFVKVLLFDHCVNYVEQLHPVIDHPSDLPFMTIVEIDRVRQIWKRLVRLLTEDYELVLSPTIPAPPQMPPGIPHPPYLSQDYRLDCLGRAIRCMAYIRDILQLCARKWDVAGPLAQFEQASASVQERLMQTRASTFYGVDGRHYVPWAA